MKVVPKEDNQGFLSKTIATLGGFLGMGEKDEDSPEIVVRKWSNDSARFMSPEMMAQAMQGYIAPPEAPARNLSFKSQLSFETNPQRTSNKY